MRTKVELRHAYRLINHGPTTLVSSSWSGRENVMAAAWVMGIDFDPPKVAAVIDSKTFTRELIEASGEFTLSVPTASQTDLVWALGKTSGRDLDKSKRFPALKTSAATIVNAPFVEGCSAWLECRVIPEKAIADRYDLILGEVVAAFADDSLFANGDWKENPRSLHHVARGVFFETGARVTAKDPPA